jgi:hypothetical protein
VPPPSLARSFASSSCKTATRFVGTREALRRLSRVSGLKAL